MHSRAVIMFVYSLNAARSAGSGNAPAPPCWPSSCSSSFVSSSSSFCCVLKNAPICLASLFLPVAFARLGLKPLVSSTAPPSSSTIWTFCTATSSPSVSPSATATAAPPAVLGRCAVASLRGHTHTHDA